MTVTIEVPERVVERAAELGVPVDALVREAVEHIGAKAERVKRLPLVESRMTREEAREALNEIARTHTLGGDITIKELIEEGRRY